MRELGCIIRSSDDTDDLTLIAAAQMFVTTQTIQGTSHVSASIEIARDHKDDDENIAALLAFLKMHLLHQAKANKEKMHKAEQLYKDWLDEFNG